MTTIKSFHDRLAKIGIDVMMSGNYPWIYLDTVNGHKVWEKYMASHGFTVFFRGVRPGQNDECPDIGRVFKKIREMLTEEGRKKDKQRYLEFMEDYQS